MEKESSFFDFLYRSNLNQETSLWKAVILQAFIDLKSNSKKKIANTHKVKATLWFNMNNNDFVATCYYAELDPQYVWRKAAIIKEMNFEKKMLELKK